MSTLKSIQALCTRFNAGAARLTQRGSALADNIGITLYASFAALSAKTGYDVLTSPAALAEYGYTMPLLSFLGSALLVSSWSSVNAIREAQGSMRADEAGNEYHLRYGSIRPLNHRYAGESIVWAYGTIGPLMMFSKTVASDAGAMTGLVAFTAACGLAVYGHYRTRSLEGQFGKPPTTNLSSNPS
jgi:hypothetical protein